MGVERVNKSPNDDTLQGTGTDNKGYARTTNTIVETIHTEETLQAHAQPWALGAILPDWRSIMNLMTQTDKENLLAALIRMEHKCRGSMFKHEYESTMRLAQELEAPQFITEYFAAKAVTAEEA
jgi:hypothetical protein